MPVARNASDCPPVQPSDFTLSLAAAYGSAGGLAPSARGVAAGETATIRPKWNENAARIDLLCKYGGGVRALCDGLTITSAGGVATVAPGLASISGFVELSEETEIGLTDDAWNFIFLRQSGAVVVNDEPAHPFDDTVFLGAVEMVSGTPSATDTSGVVYAKGGMRLRYTADPGEPGDTPDASTVFFSVTPGGAYLWDGANYQLAGVEATEFYWGTAHRTSGDTTVHDDYAPDGGPHWTEDDRTDVAAALTNIATLQGDVAALETAAEPLDTMGGTAGDVLQVVTPGSTAQWLPTPVHASRHATGQPDAIAPADIGAAAASHTHNASDITAGTVAAARLPAASDSAAGIVELAEDGETAAGKAVQGGDSRLSNSRIPTGTAGGDLGGTYPNPDVMKIRGRSVHNAAPSDGDTLTWNATDSRWQPGTPAASAGMVVHNVVAPGVGVAWANMPSSATEFLGSTIGRTLLDLTGYNTGRLVANVLTAGAAGASLKAQWSTDGSSWNDVSGLLMGIGAAGLYATGWKALPSGAKANCFWRLVGADGDGAADPAFGNVALQFRQGTGTSTSEVEDPEVVDPEEG